ncbi:MAG: protein kinase [Gemmataceae bacterium]
MAIICPHCNGSMTVKNIRAGRYTPKCARCGKTFALTVTMNPDPVFQSAPLPGTATGTGVSDPNATAPPPPRPAAKPADPNATAPPPDRSRPDLNAPTVAPEAAGSSDAAFSVVSSVRVESIASPDVTTALNQSAAPFVAAGANLEATEADVAAPPADAGVADVPPVLGGYQIVRELGRGGMGAVYLARQVSLDRPVALKTMRSEWASNASFVARFTREAYAAAQLVHHNVVQVYDIGTDRGVHYFSMEFVEGHSLGDLLKKDKRLDPAVAAGYVVQAARGLKFAHDRGMIHRDIKPDNLMVNTQGVVKVADLGLVRTPGVDEAPLEPNAVPAVPVKGTTSRTLGSFSNITMAHQAMGTPSYMAPEQARDATAVDARADIYSLGCTLYVLVTGRPVFSGGSAMEVMTRHASDPVVPPDRVAKQVPHALSDVVVKMLAKRPDDRYPSMAEVIAALEAFLGLQGASDLDRAEGNLRTLETGVAAFHAVPAARLRSLVLLAFFGGCAALFLLLGLLGLRGFAGGVLGLAVSTAVAYFVIHGVAQRSYLFTRVRDYLLSSSWGEMARGVLGVLLFAGVLALFSQLGVWVVAAIVGVGLAFAVHTFFDRRIARQRTAALADVERLLKTLRLRGLSEEALHEFVSQYAGDRWEEVFEALFGYEAKLAARARFGSGPKGPRPRYAAWREPLVRWIDARQKARQEARERRHLQAVEQKHLEKQGATAAEAKARAEAMAEAMVQKAAELKKEATLPAEAPLAADAAKKAPPPPRRVNVQELYAVAEQAPRAGGKTGRSLRKLLAAPFGNGVRFLVGGALVLVSLYWLQSNGLLPTSRVANDPSVYRSIWERVGEAEPLRLPLPEAVVNGLCSLDALAAGLLLVFSVFWRSWKIGVLTLAGAAVLVAGPGCGLVPALGPLSPPAVCRLAGGALMVLGFWRGRDT